MRLSGLVETLRGTYCPIACGSGTALADCKHGLLSKLAAVLRPSSPLKCGQCGKRRILGPYFCDECHEFLTAYFKSARIGAYQNKVWNREGIA